MASPTPGPEIFMCGFRFNPSPIEAITYYLPQLVAGAILHEAVRPVVHHADVYTCEPAELARRFFPLPRTGHRFFFTSCKKGVRVAGPGSWNLQSTTDIKDGAEAKVGEIKKFRYKKRGVFTDWLMDEFSTCCLEDAIVGDKQFVFCNIYVSPRAAPDSPAHQESAAFFAPPAPAPMLENTQAAPKIPTPVVIAPAAVAKIPAAVVLAPAAAPKRIAPQSSELPCPKRTRGSVPMIPSVVRPAGCTTPFVPQRPCVPNHGVPPSWTPSVAWSSPASAFFAPPAPAPMVENAQAAPKRPAPQCAEPPCPKRMRVAVPMTPPVVQPAAAACMMSFAPPRPCVPDHGVPPPSIPSVIRSSPASAQPPAPVPTRRQQQIPLPTQSVVRACHMPVQACTMLQHGVAPSPTPPVTRPRSVAVQPDHSAAATPLQARSPPKEQMPPPTLPVVQAPAPHCRPRLDPFEAAEVWDEEEEKDERVAAPVDLAPSMEFSAALEDAGWDELAKMLEDTIPTCDRSVMTDEEADEFACLLESEIAIVPKEEIQDAVA